MNDVPAPPARPEQLDLGPGARPGSASELLGRLRSALLAADPISQTEVEQLLARLTVELDGADLGQLSLDASGLRLDLPAPSDRPTTAAATTEPVAPPPGADRTPGRVRRAVLRARPVRLRDVPVEVEAEAADLPFRWVEGAGRAWIELPEPPAGWLLRGTARLSVPVEPMVALVRTLVTTEAAAQGLTVRRLEVELADRGPRRLQVRASAAVRKGVVGGSASATGVVSVDDDLVLHLADVRVTSRNPLLALVLLVLRGRVRRATSRPVPLAERLPPWLRVTDLQVRAGRTLTVSARCG